MGILDSILGGLAGGGQQQQGGGIGGVLGSLLGGGGQQQGGGMLGGLMGGGGGGGLGGLMSQFQNAGLGHIAQSWVGSGQNMPVSPDQLRSVFGGQQVQQMAQQSGMGEGDFLSQMSQHLPNVVDQMTPNGQYAGNEPGSVSV